MKFEYKLKNITGSWFNNNEKLNNFLSRCNEREDEIISITNTSNSSNEIIRVIYKVDKI